MSDQFRFLRFSALICSATVLFVGESNAEIGASLRVTAGVADLSQSPLRLTRTDGFAESLFRITVLEDVTSALSLEFHAVQTISAPLSESGVTEASAVSSTGVTGARYRALDLDWNQRSDDDPALYSWVDRANLKLRVRKIDITLGRQAITFGQAYFWNPLDLFQTFDPRQFDRDYKPGVDALRADFALGSFSQLTLIGSVGAEATAGAANEFSSEFWSSSWRGSAALAHLRTTIRGWDFALQAGKVYSAHQFGIGVSGEIGPLETRLEGAYRVADDPQPLSDSIDAPLVEDRLTFVLGIGRWLTPELNVEAEYLFNGAGASDEAELSLAFARVAAGEIQQVSEHLSGAMINYQFTPIVVGTFASIISLSDRSGFLQPNLTVSAASEFDVTFGAVVNWGKRPERSFQPGAMILHSEFGSLPDTYYAQGKIYF